MFCNYFLGISITIYFTANSNCLILIKTRWRTQFAPTVGDYNLDAIILLSQQNKLYSAT